MNKRASRTPAWLHALRLAFPPVVTLVLVVLTEWIARGSLTVDTLTQYIFPHAEAYLLAWALLFLIWLTVDWLTRYAPLATLIAAILGCVPAAVDFYTLQLRGEPFLPWDLAQVSEAAGVASAAGIHIQTSMVISIVIILLLLVASFFLYRGRKKLNWKPRVLGVAASAAAVCGLLFGVFLQPAVTQAIGILPDAWMQDRYYRYYGVTTSFLTNLTNLEISKPDDYSEDAVNEILDDTAAAGNYQTAPLYPASYGAVTPAGETEQNPTIIYVMDESYWDVSELEQYGFAFDTDVSANLHRLQETGASGRAYSPSFGGGTCDVEFEALTGYSVSYLPNGSKPYQQHVTRPMFSLPNYLKTQGYQTAAVHCFWAKYWSRDTAYPNLGLDTFLSLEKMTHVNKVRRHYWTSGLVTDDSMADQIIQQYESMKASSDAPVFLHAVTMQNHTNYNKDNYPDDQRVKVLNAPSGISRSTLGALEDFATGIRDADAMLGRLTDYFSQVDEPVILVFWGDHYNPIDSNYDVFTRSGYASDSSADPRLHQTTLLMWSNYSQQPVDLGTIAAYDISPVMMNIYGLKQPLYFQYLNRQLQVAYRTNTRGTVMNRDGTTTQEPTALQQQWSANHWLLQYDLMFGKGYALSRMGMEGLEAAPTGK
jgi:phosphoglycerol transferase MdoB-like AlkP superfamily enzyme